MHAANRSRSASAPEPGAAHKDAARSTARNRSTPKSAVTPQAFHFQASNHWIPSLLLLANALHLHWWPLHQTKSPEKPSFLLLHATRQALRFFNQAAICGTRRSRNVTRVWMVLMAVSASRREVGAR